MEALRQAKEAKKQAKKDAKETKREEKRARKEKKAGKRGASPEAPQLPPPPLLPQAGAGASGRLSRDAPPALADEHAAKRRRHSRCLAPMQHSNKSRCMTEGVDAMRRT